MYLLTLLFNAIEPVSIVMVYDMFNNTKDKDTKKVMIRKNLVSFLMLYGAIFVKQIFMNSQSYPIIAMASSVFPFVLYYILPTFIYHIKNRYVINRALFIFLCLALTTACVILLSFGKSFSIDSDSGWVLLFCSAGKLFQLVIARWLLQGLQFRINEIAYIAICSILSSFITDFVTLNSFLQKK